MTQTIEIQEIIRIGETRFYQHPVFKDLFTSEEGIVFNRSSGKFISIWDNGIGYKCINLPKKYRNILNAKSKYLLHRLVFESVNNRLIPNNFEINHISHRRNENNIKNLELVTRSENQRDISGYRGKKFEFVEKIPKNSIGILNYNKYFFPENKYYYNTETDKLYFKNKNGNIRIINEYNNNKKDGKNYIYYNLFDINNNRVSVSKIKLLKYLI